MSGATRVLLTADAVGGVWQYATDIAAALAPQGVEASVALLGPPPSAAQRAAAEAAGVRLIETGLPLDWLCDDAAPVARAGAAIADLAAREGAECVQLNMPTLTAGIAFPVPVVAVTHGCVSTWWEGARDVPLDPRYHWHREAMRRGLAAADRVVAPSAAYADMVARHYALLARPLVVHNGRRPMPLPRAQALHDHVFTAARLWDQCKDAALLDRVAARLPVPFFAAGAARGPHGETFRAEALVLLGELDEAGMARRLAARPIYASAARFEPFGLAVLEAAAAGCALVLSDIATFRELWSDAAIFVPVGDERGFARAIQALCGDEAHRRLLGERARQRAAAYAPAAMARGMAHIYDGLVARRDAA